MIRYTAMNIRSHARLLLLTVVAMIAFLPLSNASAQGLLSFLWGGGSREVVSFDPSHQPGQIIVSFGDKRLYFIHRRGEAISYPIAIPREKSRWAGATTVSDKRVNPGWTPTAEMRRENPRLPAHVPGGHPQNPLGVRALYLARACTAFTALTHRGQSATRSQRDVFAFTTKTCSTSIRAFLSAHV